MATDVLSSLPVELLTIVVANLEWKDYAAFRLTCRRIEDAMFSSFARNSFTTCRVMRTPESIQTLIDISKSRLGPFVQRLSISTEVLCPIPEIFDSPWPSQSDFAAEMTADQEAFISTGFDRDMLTQALVNLQSVQSIQVRKVYSTASYSTSTTPRDPSVKQRSLGLKKILLEQQETAESDARQIPPTRAGDVHSDMTCIYSTFLALGKANTHVKALEFAVKVGSNCKALQIPPCIAPSAIPVLAQLESLGLSISPVPSLGPPRGPSLTQGEPRMTSTHGLRVLLQYTTQLRSLHLSLDGLHDRYDGFIEWLASVPPHEAPIQDALPQSPPAITLNYLRDLRINGVRGVHVQDLLSVVRKLAPTLEELHFHRVHLESRLQDQVSTSGAPGRLWTELLKSLDTEPTPELRRLCIWDAKETVGVGVIHHMRRVPRDVTFAKGLERYASCAYSGPAMKQALEAMIHYLEGDGSWTFQSREGKWTFSRSKHGPKKMLFNVHMLSS